MTSKARLEFNVSAPMYFRTVLIGNAFRRVESPRICFKVRDCIREMLITSFTCCQEPAFGSCAAWNSKRGLVLISSSLLTPQRSMPFLRDAVGLDFAEAIGPVRISRRRRSAFHDESRAIPWRCPPKAVDAMKWPSSQLSLLILCNMRTTIVDHGPVGHILNLWSLFMSHISLHGARKGSQFSTLGPGTSWAVTFYNVIGNAGSHPGKEISQIATSCGRNAGRQRDFVVHPWCGGRSPSRPGTGQ